MPHHNQIHEVMSVPFLLYLLFHYFLFLFGYIYLFYIFGRNDSNDDYDVSGDGKIRFKYLFFKLKTCYLAWVFIHMYLRKINYSFRS